MKFLLWALVIGGLWWWWRAKQRAPVGRARPGPDAARPAVAAPEPMVTCTHCGLHLPSSEALEGPDGSRHYCSEAHRKADARG